MPIRPAVPLPGPIVYVPGRGSGCGASCFVYLVVVPLVATLIVVGASAVLVALSIVIAIELVRLAQFLRRLWLDRDRGPR